MAVTEYAKDSAVLIFRVLEGGKYAVNVYQFSTSPPPVAVEQLLNNNPPAAGWEVRRDEGAANKAELETKLVSWLTSLFDT